MSLVQLLPLPQGTPKNKVIDEGQDSRLMSHAFLYTTPDLLSSPRLMLRSTREITCPSACLQHSGSIQQFVRQHFARQKSNQANLFQANRHESMFMLYLQAVSVSVSENHDLSWSGVCVTRRAEYDTPVSFLVHVCLSRLRAARKKIKINAETSISQWQKMHNSFHKRSAFWTPPYFISE